MEFLLKNHSATEVGEILKLIAEAGKSPVLKVVVTKHLGENYKIAPATVELMFAMYQQKMDEKMEESKQQNISNFSIDNTSNIQHLGSSFREMLFAHTHAFHHLVHDSTSKSNQSARLISGSQQQQQQQQQRQNDNGRVAIGNVQGQQGQAGPVVRNVYNGGYGAPGAPMGARGGMAGPGAHVPGL